MNFNTILSKATTPFMVGVMIVAIIGLLAILIWVNQLIWNGVFGQFITFSFWQIAGILFLLAEIGGMFHKS